MILNKTGINLLSLGQEAKKSLVDGHGMNRMLHSLDAYNFLKIDPKNMLNFKC